MLNQSHHFGWGVSVYPSGHFVLWRKNNGEAPFKEAFASVGYGYLRGSETLYDVSKSEIGIQWFDAVEGVDLPELFRVGGGSTETRPVTPTLGLSMSLTQKKRRRGLGGLTARGKVLVREGATALERSYGTRNLAFWTCTLPTMSIDDMKNVCTNWGRICENVKKKLVYHLRARGLPEHIVQVTELQERRWRQRNEPAWHMHWLFVGRKSGSRWSIPRHLTDKLWRDAVEQYCSGGAIFSHSCQLIAVRKSAAGYLSKYMSKGGSVIEEVESVFPGCVPSSFYVCTRSLRTYIDRHTMKSEAMARWVHQMLLECPEEMDWLWDYQVPGRGGMNMSVCWLGSSRALVPEIPPLTW